MYLTFCRLQRCFVCLAPGLILLSGCTLPGGFERTTDGEVVHSSFFPDYRIVTIRPGDSFKSLAGAYLQDESLGALIAEFNGISQPVAGQKILVPVEPYRPGGLSLDGYQTVPVLTYHNFSHNKSNKMTVLAKDFEAQMRHLKEHGYNVVSMASFIKFIEFRAQLPEKSVVITIDDGWESVYTIAYPILKKYSFPATLFLYTDLIDGEANHLDWSEVREMSDHLIDMQCHTRTHRYLSKRKADESYLDYAREIKRELEQSAQLIETKTGKEVDLLAYPYGETNHLVSAYALKNGFRAGFSVRDRANPFFVSRYRINRSMIFGGYDIDRFSKTLSVYKKSPLGQVDLRQ